MRLIFLNIDGVIALMKPGYGHFIDMNKVLLLRRLCEATGARIVICSSWRKKTLAQTKKALPALLRKYIVGQTPDLSSTKKYGGDPAHLRFYEIWAWMLRHDGIESYVVLDDNSEPYENIALGWCALITTDPKVGLTEQDANNALTMLEHPWIITDADNRQRCRIHKNEHGNDIYEYEQENAEGDIVSDIIDLDDYTLDEAFENKYLATYGYTLENVKRYYKDSWRQIVAECIFETENQ